MRLHASWTLDPLDWVKKDLGNNLARKCLAGMPWILMDWSTAPKCMFHRNFKLNKPITFNITK